ncbi:Stealth CR1 domain-containing protein [Micromonosporaceae bacterium Da 78-11]
MKITFLLTWADAVGGTERIILRQASWLAQRHDVEVISVFKTRPALAFDIDERVRVRFLVDSTREVQRTIENDIDEQTCRALAQSPSTLVDPGWEGAFNALADLEVERVLSTSDADVVVSSTPALLAVAATLAPQAALVHQEHRVTELRGPSGGPFRLFTPRAEAVVLLSEPTRDWFSTLLQDAAPRLEIIPNALEPNYRPLSARETRTIVWAGRLTSEKQPLHAVRAFAAIADEYPGWTLRFFGDGPEADRIRREVAAQRLGNRVQVMGASQVLDQEWAKASVCLVTSRTESFSLVALEAMAAAVPVVAYDCPNGPRELIRDGETGFLVPPDDNEELAAALGKILGDADLRHRMGDAALEFSARFEIDPIMERWDRLYLDLAADRAQPGWRERRLRRVAAFRAVRSAIGARDSAPVSSATSGDVDAWAAMVEATVPGLVWSNAQLTRVEDEFSAADVAARNLGLAGDALETAGVDYWLVNRANASTYTLAVSAADRELTIAALARHGADRPAYGEFLNNRGRGVGVRPVIALPGLLAGDRSPAVRVFEPVVTSGRTLRFGSVYGCVIEFWEDTEEGDRVLAPRGTPVGSSLPKAAMTRTWIEVNERRLPTLEPFTRTLVNDIVFPIDVVYTWVDGNDPQWQAKRHDRLDRPDHSEAAEGSARYRARDELRYSLRSLDLFAPWVRHIWLVTDDQRPDWLDTDHPRVTVVDHRQIFTDQAALPSFNSHSIESQLHHIPGLAEHFLYFNDDFFVGRVVKPSAFFTPGGLPKFFISPTLVEPTPVRADDDFNMAAAKNNRDLLNERYGRMLTNGLLHAPYALRRSTLAAVEEEFAEPYRRTMHSRVRAASDISLVSSFAHYFGLITGRAVTSDLKVGFVNVGLREHHARLDRMLLHRGHDVFCLNDFHDADVPDDEQSQIIDSFLQAYFPVAGQFERGSARNRRFTA